MGSFSRSKRVNRKIICLCTRSEENPFTCRSSTAMVIELCFFMKKMKKMKNVKVLYTCISYLVIIFAMQLPFYMFSTLMSLRRQIEETEISLCMAIMLDHPWQFLYTQYYRTTCTHTKLKIRFYLLNQLLHCNVHCRYMHGLASFSGSLLHAHTTKREGGIATKDGERLVNTCIIMC